MSPYQPINLLGWGAMIDYNIFTDELALDEAHKKNTDGHSVFFPVYFQDAEHGNYSVKSDNNAVFRMGFQNFDMNNFGVVSATLKHLAKTPRMSLPLVKTGNTEAKTIAWQGWRVKNLETPGERSATGMDSEHGVYVVTLYAFDSSIKDYLQPNDVILKFDSKTVNNLDDLVNAVKHTDLTKPINMVIFRYQKENIIAIPANKITAYN